MAKNARSSPSQPKQRESQPTAPTKTPPSVLADYPRGRFWSREGKRGIPGLGVSVLVHVVILAILAQIAFQNGRPGGRDAPIELTWASANGDSGGGGSGGRGRERSLPIEPISLKTQPAIDASAFAENPTIPAVAAKPETPQVVPVNVSNSLANRIQSGTGGGQGGGDGTGKGTGKGAGKAPAGIGKGAGSGKSTGTNEDARKVIDRGLQWIVRQQAADGRWKLTGPYPDPGTIETDTGATSLALLALLGDGNTHRDGPFHEAVAKGIAFLQRTQRKSGDLFDQLEEGKEAHFYSHAQGTIALCECLALTHDEELRPAATKAVQFLIRAQNPVKGGWKYRPLDENGIGDLSVTGWALMALHTARMAEIEVPLDTFYRASTFLDAAEQTPGDGASYKYRPDFPINAEQTLAMSAEGLLCRQWLGWPRNMPDLHRGIDRLTSTNYQPRWEAGLRNVYAWYYTAQALHNYGGDAWSGWYPRVQDLVMKHQGGNGSWDPSHPRGAFLEWSHGAGRLYFTVICLLIMETPYRHAPVYPENAAT